jgi:hypothetical protein
MRLEVQHDHMAVNAAPQARQLPRECRAELDQQGGHGVFLPPRSVDSKNVIENHNYAPGTISSKVPAVFERQESRPAASKYLEFQHRVDQKPSHLSSSGQ